MRTARIQIGDGQILDTYKRWGFLVLDNGEDKARFSPPEKKRDKTSYAGEAGAHEDPRTVYDEFDYKMRFIIEAPNKDYISVNSKIRAWNEAVRERTAGSGVLRCKTVMLYDDFMRCKIVGSPELIAEADKDGFYRHVNGSVMDCAVVELIIHVSDPTLSEFDMPKSNTQEYSMWDLQPGWWIAHGVGARVYFVQNDPYLRNIVIPCTAGTKVTYGMRTYGDGVDWIVRDTATGLCAELKKDPTHTPMEGPVTKTFTKECEFIINHDTRINDEFYLLVDNSGVSGLGAKGADGGYSAVMAARHNETDNDRAESLMGNDSD